MAFCKRHSRRCHMGDVVDKYLHLVDKYQPRVFAEARIYVARFPEQAGSCSNRSRRSASRSANRGEEEDGQDQKPPAGRGKLLHQRRLQVLHKAGEQTVKMHRVKSQHQRQGPSMRKRGTQTQSVREGKPWTLTRRLTGETALVTMLHRRMSGLGGKPLALPTGVTARATLHFDRVNQVRGDVSTWFPTSNGGECS